MSTELNEYQIDDKIVSLGGNNFVVITKETYNRAEQNMRQMGEIVLQMGNMLTTMQKRLDELEEKQKQITLSHEEVKTVQELISRKVWDYCEKYDILAPGAMRSIRAGIKRAILTRYGVKDLHDIPAVARQAVEAQIDHWSDIRLMMKCRERIRAG